MSYRVSFSFSEEHPDLPEGTVSRPGSLDPTSSDWEIDFSMKGENAALVGSVAYRIVKTVVDSAEIIYSPPF